MKVRVALGVGLLGIALWLVLGRASGAGAAAQGGTPRHIGEFGGRGLEAGVGAGTAMPRGGQEGPGYSVVDATNPATSTPTGGPIGTPAPECPPEWRLVPPARGLEWDNLYDVAAVSASDVWAVGYYRPDGAQEDRSLVLHMDEQGWSVVPSPNLGAGRNVLYGVAVVSPSNVWAVGWYYDFGCCGGHHVLTLQWDGIEWSVDTSSNLVAGTGALVGATALGDRDLWTVGVEFDDVAGQDRSLIERRNNECVPTGTPTHTPTATPTATPTFTATPTGTPVIVGHVVWQGRAGQPSSLQQLPITLTLRSGVAEANYAVQTTDASGWFTDSIASLSSGLYQWRVKGHKYLANGGTITLTAGVSAQAEMGLMQVGDCNDDDTVNAQDFAIFKATFGKGLGEPGYDERAEFNGNDIVNAVDMSLLRLNYGHGGAPPIGP